MDYECKSIFFGPIVNKKVVPLPDVLVVKFWIMNELRRKCLKDKIHSILYYIDIKKIKINK